MNENVKWIAGAVAVVGLSLGGLLYLSGRDKKAPLPEPPAPASIPAPVQAAPEEPAIKHPLAATETKSPLPALNESDAPMQNALTELLGKESVQQFIVPSDLIRHFVVSVDNLTEQKVAERLRPVRRISGDFAVGGVEDARVLDPANYERYNSLVQLIQTSDTKTLVATYVHYYPLFQEAYESLGHPPQYFNDRLIQVIDVLLETPDVPGPIALAQPNVLYEFADPKLEALPAGQKVLIRMGSDNAKAVKDKLRELRSELAAQPAR